jgi:hypothetical protein
MFYLKIHLISQASPWILNCLEKSILPKLINDSIWIYFPFSLKKQLVIYIISDILLIASHYYISPLMLWVWTLLRWDVLDTTLCDKVCQWLATGRWFSLCPPVSSTNNTDCNDIAEILLNVALNTIKQKTLSHNVVHLALIEIGTHNIRHWLHRW